MAILTGAQRKLLSDVVVQAREVVEAACEQRIAALGVDGDKAPPVLTKEERAVRVGLRARLRQLGSVEALVTEAGFEHWHRMLFARFLADNGLMVDDIVHQPVSIEGVAEYATELGEGDMWEVAARFSAAMLPGIFRQDDPILAMRLPVETRQELERLLDRLPVEIITAEDALGWVYQYWQARRKDEVNKSERKIGGADLPPVTQLFTENYMVRFLLENSLGAWWAAHHPESPLLAGWEYLRRNEDGSPAVGGFDGWPQRVAEVTVMDPCCGSGHFLTAAFGMLWRMRAEEEHLDPATAQNAVLRDNLFGLELDPRCTQIAMFALALEAWKDGGYRDLPLPNVACCGIPARAPLQDWLNLAGGDPMVEAALTRLHALFANADTLGSLIDPVRAAEQAGLESVDWHQVAPLVREALTAETGHHATDPAAAVFGHAAAGIARAADYLSRRYALIATNPPFLGRALQDDRLSTHSSADHPSAAHDLATVFLERARQLRSVNGAAVLVLPQGWLFLSRFRPLRRSVSHADQVLLVAQLGEGAFQSPAAAGAFVCLFGSSSSSHRGDYLGLDASSVDGAASKAEHLRHSGISKLEQSRCATEERIMVQDSPQGGLQLADRARAWQGLVTGDANRYCMRFWEVSDSSTWTRMVSAPDSTEPYRGRTSLLRWEDGQGSLVRSRGAHNFNPPHVVGKRGVLLAQVRNLAATLYDGEPFHDASCPLIPSSESDLAALWAYCSSPEYALQVRKANPSLVVRPGYLVKVPFDVEHWRAVAAEELPNGLPEPFSDDPTQWLFRGGVVDSRFPLQVAVARLLGFRWPDQQPDALDELADVDGVVCLPALGGESTAEERLRALLASAFGDSRSPQTLDTLLAEAGGKPGSGGLKKWLRDGFFKHHCSVFANRPFIWHIWDGRPDGFSALVNYHKLDRKLLERLTYDYLGSWWIGRLSDEIRQRVPGGEERLAAAEDLKTRLKLILEGEPPYDIYVRWRALAEQPMGWEPDLDDGIRLNIRPFMTAGVLRAMPNIKWEKDRGKHSDGTERFNDLHFTLADKRAARRRDGQ